MARIAQRSRALLCGALLSCAAPHARAEQAASRDTFVKLPNLPAQTSEPRGREGCTPYSPERVRFSGVLVIHKRLGPPGFGETPAQDKRIPVPLLVFDDTVDMCV